MGNQMNRLKKIEAATRRSAHTLTTYHCIIDGEAVVMTALDFAYVTAVEGKQGTMGKVAGEVPFDPPEPGALDEAFQAMKDEYEADAAERQTRGAETQ